MKDKVDSLYDTINEMYGMKNKLDRKITERIVQKLISIHDIVAEHCYYNFKDEKGKTYKEAKEEFFSEPLAYKVINGKLKEASTDRRIQTFLIAAVKFMEKYKKNNKEPHPAYLGPDEYHELQPITTTRLSRNEGWKDIDENFDDLKSFLEIPDEFWIKCAEMSKPYASGLGICPKWDEPPVAKPEPIPEPETKSKSKSKKKSKRKSYEEHELDNQTKIRLLLENSLPDEYKRKVKTTTTSEPEPPKPMKTTKREKLNLNNEEVSVQPRGFSISSTSYEVHEKPRGKLSVSNTSSYESHGKPRGKLSVSSNSYEVHEKPLKPVIDSIKLKVGDERYGTKNVKLNKI